MSAPWEIRVGDALTVLRTMEAGSVQCCVTSPPYYNLRTYDTAAVVWDGNPACDHEWDAARKRGTGNRPSHATGQAGGVAHLRTMPDTTTNGQFCQRCGAWRGELGAEPNPDLYICHLVTIFDEVRRVLRPDGVCFVNLAGTYAGSGKGAWGITGIQKERYVPFVGDIPNANRTPPGYKPKDWIPIPWLFGIAMQQAGWWLRCPIIWSKSNPMPSSVTDRPTISHEYILMFTKQDRYYWDQDAIREPQSDWHASGSLTRFGSDETLVAANAHRGERLPEINPLGRNARTVWDVSTMGFSGNHFAVFPPELPRRCILAGTSEHGCCPACGAPWVRLVEHTPASARQKPGYLAATGVRNDGERAGSFTGHRTTMLGWQPSCTCPSADRVPCVVLGPFCGAGTTGLVANRLGRAFIGIELNPEYATMARDRIHSDAPLLFATSEPEAGQPSAQAALL